MDFKSTSHQLAHPQHANHQAISQPASNQISSLPANFQSVYSFLAYYGTVTVLGWLVCFIFPVLFRSLSALDVMFCFPSVLPDCLMCFTLCLVVFTPAISCRLPVVSSQFIVHYCFTIVHLCFFGCLVTSIALRVSQCFVDLYSVAWIITCLSLDSPCFVY